MTLPNETPDHLWFWIDACHYPQVSFTKPEGFKTVEYIRLQCDWNKLDTFKPACEHRGK